MAVGYVGIGFQKVAERVSRTEGLTQIAKWIYLFPIIEGLQRSAANKATHDYGLNPDTAAW
jgi:hypothetical protein